MAKTPYTGNELRIDGYYYSNLYSKLTLTNDIGIAVFYRDGVCIHMITRIEEQDTLGYIENEILQNDDFLSRLWNTPTHIGVFRINMEAIEFETWEAGRDITTYSHFGEILNDTTFLLKERINNDQDLSFSVNIAYRFKQFSPKPDSTNSFIK